MIGAAPGLTLHHTWHHRPAETPPDSGKATSGHRANSWLMPQQCDWSVACQTPQEGRSALLPSPPPERSRHVGRSRAAGLGREVEAAGRRQGSLCAPRFSCENIMPSGSSCTFSGYQLFSPLSLLHLSAPKEADGYTSFRCGQCTSDTRPRPSPPSAGSLVGDAPGAAPAWRSPLLHQPDWLRAPLQSACPYASLLPCWVLSEGGKRRSVLSLTLWRRTCRVRSAAGLLQAKQESWRPCPALHQDEVTGPVPEQPARPPWDELPSPGSI